MRLVFDRERRDVYGRLLAYVYTRARGEAGGPRFVNAALVRDGYARTLEIAPNTAHAPLFAASQAARRPGRPGPVGRLLRRQCGVVRSAPARTSLVVSTSAAPPRLPSGPRGTLAPARASSGDHRHEDATDIDQFELAFEQEAALERRRRTQLRQRAANRSRARRMQRTEQRGNVAFGVLVVALTLTVSR